MRTGNANRAQKTKTTLKEASKGWGGEWMPKRCTAGGNQDATCGPHTTSTRQSDWPLGNNTTTAVV